MKSQYKTKVFTIIIFMLTILSAAYFTHIKAEAASQYDYVKIGLKFGSGAVQTCTLKSEQGFLLGTADNSGFTEGMPLPAYTTIIATVENGAVTLRDENGTLLTADLGSNGCIMPYNYLSEGIFSFDNTPYRGGLMLKPNSNGTMTVISFLSLENYIYGVINAELGNANPSEALKAQAVAARSFGAMNIGKHSADGFDLCATTHCQVYKGYSGEYASTNKAVDDTRDEMIYSEGKLVNAFYYKNSGGYTQNAEDVWSYSQPYLKSVKDEYSPNYSWNASLSFDMIKQKLESAGYDPGEIQSVMIKNRNTTGNVSELLIAGSNSSVSLTKEKIRNVLGTTVIKSTRFSLSDSTSQASDDSLKISNGSTDSSAGTEFYMISGSGKVTKVQTNTVYGSNGTSTTKINSQSESETATGRTVTFNGSGYGHGVGMPQDSAVEMAKQGFTYKEILQYYYTDIEVK